ncbi:MAG: hypothetical protein GVY36_09620 [Verrucomicrobia bacterium]|jgi:hypothetical protein|nr:hypothetical protein [Verrucomicrobiota bacterium]
MHFQRLRLISILLFAPLGLSIAGTQTQTDESTKTTASSEAAEAIASWQGTVFRIKDAKSRVSLASVKLSVSDLKPKDGNLVGEYTIEVPLMNSKNDHGKIVLPLDINMDNLDVTGGTLRGKAISYKDDTESNIIVCRIFPGEEQFIELDITTNDRTIQFESRYTIVEQPKGS